MQKCLGAGGKRLSNAVEAVQSGDNNEPGRRKFRANQPDGFNATNNGQVKIRDGDVRLQRFKLLNGLFPVDGFAGDQHIRLGINQGADSFPYYGMIIHDQDSYLLTVYTHTRP
jgi:hypothetical protein